MKKILLTLSGFLITLLGIAQSPNLMNYQGVARNAAGNVLPNQPVALRLTILSGTTAATGTAVYSETRSVTTNAFGLFNVVVGSPGAITSTGSIAGINWTAFGAGSGNKFLQVEIDPVGGSNFVNVGATQLVSVPYALNAAGAAPVGPAGGDLTGTYPNPTVAGLRGRTVSAAAPANKNLLMWDAATTSWIPATAAQAGVVSGTGTLNMVPKWTPDGVTLGNSQIFDNGTNVGVGTLTPTNKFTVAAGDNDGIAINNTGTNFANAALAFSNVTTAPAQTNTANIVLKSGAGDRALQFLNSSAGLAAGDVIYRFYNNALAPVAVILNGGDVGIGTAGPVDRFHVVKGGNSGMLLGGGANTGSEAKFLSYGTSHISIYNRGNNALTFAQTSSLSQTNTLGVELMALTTAGNLGIGTVTPGQRLTVVDAGNANQYSGTLSVFANNLTQGVGIGYMGIQALGSNANQDLALNARAAGNITMQTVGTTGNVGIGNAAPTSKLQVDNTGTNLSLSVTQSNAANGQNGLQVWNQNATANNSLFAGNAISSLRGNGGSVTLFTNPSSIYAASTTTVTGGIGIQGFGPTAGVAGITVDGFALYGLAAGTGYGLVTSGRVQISGQGAAAGRVLTSDAAGNATWQDLITPPVHLSGSNVSATTIPVGGVVTPIITWGGLDEAGGANYTPATGSYTIPVAGYYSVFAHLVWNTLAPSAGANDVAAVILVNGGEVARGYSATTIAGSIPSDPIVQIERRFNAGDVIRFAATQNTTGPMDLFNTGTACKFGIHLVHK